MPDTIRDFSFIKGCNEEQIQTIEQVCKDVKVNQDHYLYMENDIARNIYLVRSGILEMIAHTSDSEKRLYFGQLRQGDIFGFGEIFFDNYYISVVARTDCRLFAISKQDFFDVLMSISTIHSYITHSLAHIARGCVLAMVRSQADSQLKYLLYFYATRLGQNTDKGIEIKKELSQSRIAEMLNITREHVARLIRQLKQESILIENYPRFVIHPQWYRERLKDPDYDETLNRYYHIN